MKLLTLLSQALARGAKQLWALPHTIENVLLRRRQRAERNANEVERLDRIRQPWKYLGK